jgi:hypothetical protein
MHARYSTVSSREEAPSLRQRGAHTHEVEGRLFQKFRADVVLGNVAPRPTLGVSCRALLRHAAVVLLRLDFWVGLSSIDG